MVLVLKSWNGKTLSGTYLEDTQVPDLTHSWTCSSLPPNPFQSCYWFSGRGAIYITESVYKSLSDAEKAHARSRSTGCVKDSGWYVWVKKAYSKNWYKFNPDTVIPYPEDDPCAGVVCKPECVGTDRYATVCKDGKCVRGSLMESNSAECGYVKPECTPGDKKPGEICNIEGSWVPHTPGEPVPGAGRLYVKFDVPYLDLLPGIPYEPWMWIPPGFKIVEV